MACLIGIEILFVKGAFYNSTGAEVYDTRHLQIGSVAGSSPKGLSLPTDCCWRNNSNLHNYLNINTLHQIACSQRRRRFSISY